MEICQYQPLSKGQYADLQDNLDVMIISWTYAISNFVAWDGVEKSRKWTESFTKILQGQRKT